MVYNPNPLKTMNHHIVHLKLNIILYVNDTKKKKKGVIISLDVTAVGLALFIWNREHILNHVGQSIIP